MSVVGTPFPWPSRGPSRGWAELGWWAASPRRPVPGSSEARPTALLAGFLPERSLCEASGGMPLRQGRRAEGPRSDLAEAQRAAWAIDALCAPGVGGVAAGGSSGAPCKSSLSRGLRTCTAHPLLRVWGWPDVGPGLRNKDQMEAQAHLTLPVRVLLKRKEGPGPGQLLPSWEGASGWGQSASDNNGTPCVQDPLPHCSWGGQWIDKALWSRD